MACCWAGSPWDLGFNIFEEADVLNQVSSIKSDVSWGRVRRPRNGDLCMAPFACEEDLEEGLRLASFSLRMQRVFDQYAEYLYSVKTILTIR